MAHSANTIEELYQKHLNTFSDTQHHLGLFRYFASRGKTAIELGTRTGVSTAALLASGAHVTSVDLEYHKTDVDQLAWLCGEKFLFLHGDSLKVPIKDAYDLAFFDSLHTYAHLKAELERYEPRVGRYMIFHDTKLFRDNGEDGTKPGLHKAITRYTDAAPYKWKTVLDLDNCCGLMVLERQ